MSDVELLREAAAKMREGPDVRWHAVADWLDKAASGFQYLPPRRHDMQAVVVARAYLGESS